jgi:LTXXQ motif family protein
MLPQGRGFVAVFLGIFSIAFSAGAFAQPGKHGGPPAAAAPAARPAAPPAMARPAAPPAMARPAAPPMTARPAPHIAAPSRPAMPHVAAPRPSFHQAAPQRPAMARPERPHIAAPSRPSTPPAVSARQSRQQQVETRASQREQRAQQHIQDAQPRIQERQQAQQQRQQAVQERQRAALSRETADRQSRIDRMQKHVQELRAKKPEGLRAQRAQERLLQAQNRQLQREQSMQQRDQARLQKLGPQPQAERSAAAIQAASRGRFAARFGNKDPLQAQAALAARHNGWSPRDAWRHKKRATFVAFLGPVFWPYAYSDIFEYTFWPSAYEPGYWAYAYDDFVDTVFWGPDNRYSAYASYPAGGEAISGGRARERTALSPQTFRQLCGNPQSGVTAWPIAEITKTVRPTAEQRALLDELKAAAAKAADVFKQSCEDSFALTPPGRLRAMTNRVRATLEAVRIVRPALEKFYASLSDEQQARFNQIGPSNLGDSAQQQEAAAPSESCGDPKSGLTQLPIDRIEAVTRPAGKQKQALDHLNGATRDAVKTLQAACPDSVPLTPVGRLEAMEKRLAAMLHAADRVQPALDEFYATLSSEQKARFNTMPRVAGQ